MNSQSLIRTALVVLLYVSIQVLFVRNLVLYDVAFCFVYLIAILWLPGDMDTLWVILISFLIGLIVDSFYNTGGIHAAACTLIGYLRKSILLYFFPGKGIENDVVVTLLGLGHQRYRYLLFVGVMVLIHHLFLFLVESGDMSLLIHSLAKVLFSTLFTAIVIYLSSVFTSNLSSQK